MEPLPAFPPTPSLNLDRLLQSLTDPMNIIDKDYRVVWSNDPDPEPGQIGFRVEGRICYRVFMGREEPCEDCPVRKVFESGRAQVMEKRVEFDSGLLLHTEVHAYPIFDSEGELNRVIKIGHDIRNGRPGLNRAGDGTAESAPVNASLGSEISPRELEVLRLLVRGRTNVEIAEALEISPHTVKTHVISLFNKFGTSKRTETAVMAVKMGLV